MLVGSQGVLRASVTGQGSYIMQAPEPVALMQSAPEHPISLGLLAFGMLMMQIGFGLHAWYVLQQNQEGSPVTVHAKKKSPRKSRRQAEVIWIERTIRF